MRRTPLVSAVAIAAAMAFTASSAQAGIQNVYHDGRDLAVASAAGNNFRLDLRRLEPNCFTALALGLRDVGDSNRSLDALNVNPTYSIDQMLVPGTRTGYRVVNQFDTGTITTDPDIDPGQTGVGINGPMYRDAVGGLSQDDTDLLSLTIVCVSDHDDAGQNEPYAASVGGTNEVRDANEVYAKNRPIIQPTVAALGQSAIAPLKTYKLGFGYSIEKWYSTANAGAGGETPLLRLTDPMGFFLDKLVNTPVLGGFSTAAAIDTERGHVVIPPRINGPRFNAVHDGPGVLRVNDIDINSEPFGDPHFEPSNYGQTDVFEVKGDAQSWCLGGFSCAGLLTVGTQGDLPISWHVKASLAAVSSLRSVTFTSAQFDAWEKGWQAYYCGAASHPTLPLAPGTNSPTPNGSCPAVNPPETRPGAAPQVQVTVPAPVVNVPAPGPAAKQTCTSKRQVKFAWPKSSKSGRLIYRGKTVAAKRSNGRLRATADLRGMVATPGDYMKVVVVTKRANNRTVRTVRTFKVC